MTMDWDDVRYFLALARDGSVRAAGASLQVSHSTVARRVEALEAQLSTRLFDRSLDGYTLTAAGHAMLPGAERIEREIADVERALVGRDERLAGTVAITCGENFVGAMLLQALGAFCLANPAIELHFTIDARPFDLSRREADLAVRVLPPGTDPPEYVFATKVAPVIVASYVAVAHADRLDPTRAGSSTRWLAFDDPKATDRLIATSSYPSIPAWGSFGALESLVAAARAGLGLVMLPVYVGDGEPTLQRLPNADPRHLADLWLLSHPDLRHTARVKAVREQLARAFVDAAERFQP